MSWFETDERSVRKLAPDIDNLGDQRIQPFRHGELAFFPPETSDGYELELPADDVKVEHGPGPLAGTVLFCRAYESHILC